MAKKPVVPPSQEQKDEAAVRAVPSPQPEGEGRNSAHADNLAASPSPSDGEAAAKSVDQVEKKGGMFGAPSASGEVSVPVAQATYGLVSGLDRFAGVVMTQMKNGWQTQEDLGPVMGSAISDLSPALSNIPAVVEEFKADKRLFANAVFIGLGGIVARFMNKG